MGRDIRKEKKKKEEKGLLRLETSMGEIVLQLDQSSDIPIINLV